MGFIKKIFRPNIPAMTITGRDLLSSTSSEESDSPQMGNDAVNQKKRRGINSLLVQNENIYKGGV